MKYLKVKNWTEFQHYRDRNPPWIKLHRALLDDYEFSCLQDASKAHLMLIWLFASQRNGCIPEDPVFLKKKLGLEKEPNLNLFIDHGLLIPEQSASTNAEQDASKALGLEEERRSTTEKNKSIVGLEPNLAEQAKEVLNFLNDKTGRHYEPVRETLDPILARLKGGSSVEDLRAVIAKKTREWGADEKMQKYLRPKTLFNATNFANYKGELEAA